jgi:hypothetical protein
MLTHERECELAEEVSWLAIRQPAVMRLLERELASDDGDAYAAGLELACRILGGRTPLARIRLDHNMLSTGLVAVRTGRLDRAMVRSLRDQVEELPVVLTPGEQDAVATTVAAILWSLLDATIESLEEADAA